MNKKLFETPRVIGQLDLELRSSILNESVVNDAVVTSAGQEVQHYSFSEGNTGGFNHEWK